MVRRLSSAVLCSGRPSDRLVVGVEKASGTCDSFAAGSSGIEQRAPVRKRPFNCTLIWPKIQNLQLPSYAYLQSYCPSYYDNGAIINRGNFVVQEELFVCSIKAGLPVIAHERVLVARNMALVNQPVTLLAICLAEASETAINVAAIVMATIGTTLL